MLDELKADEDPQAEDSIVDGENVVVIDVTKSPDISTQVEIFNPPPARGQNSTTLNLFSILSFTHLFL